MKRDEQYKIIQPSLEADKVPKSKKVFIVHGRDETLSKKVQKLLLENDIEPIVLHQQTSSGRLIYENLEKYTEVAAAIVLYTPDDVGKFITDKELRPRARMNVIFEHGLMLQKLGRERVIMINDDVNIELPTDILGITYIDSQVRGWRKKLCQELITMKVIKECKDGD